jgi:uncharacterized membrane protein
MDQAFVTGNAAILATLTGICAFYFWLEKATRWRLFNYVPPLVFIYLTPVLLSNSGNILTYLRAESAEGAAASGAAAAVGIPNVLPTKSPAYDVVKDFALPMMLVLMLLNVDVAKAVRVVGKGVGVMVIGSLGVVVGAAVGYACVKQWLGPDSWKAYAALTGSWVGGTGNLAAVADAVGANGTQFGLAVLADTALLLIWLPVMLASKKIAAPFARFANVDPERVAYHEALAIAEQGEGRAPNYQDFLLLLFTAFAVTAFSSWFTLALTAEFAKHGRVWPVQFSEDTARILLITTIGIALSFTPLRQVPSSRHLGMALVFIFMARTGATADLAQAAEQAVPFLIGAAICISIHGLFCLAAAKFLRVDIHTAAIASAANIGGIATASCVAAHHKESLMPAAVLLALLGYAIGNYAGLLTAAICESL